MLMYAFLVAYLATAILFGGRDESARTSREERIKKAAERDDNFVERRLGPNSTKAQCTGGTCTFTTVHASSSPAGGQHTDLKGIYGISNRPSFDIGSTTVVWPYSMHLYESESRMVSVRDNGKEIRAYFVKCPVRFTARAFRWVKNVPPVSVGDLVAEGPDALEARLRSYTGFALGVPYVTGEPYWSSSARDLQLRGWFGLYVRCSGARAE